MSLLAAGDVSQDTSVNVGVIQACIEERVSFKLDGNPFATETRTFSIEGTGILPSEDPCE